MLTVPRRDLREYLAQVPDPRGRKGRRHVFAATLTAVVCAILQNCRGYVAIGQWQSEQPLDFLHALGFWRTPPSASGMRKWLLRIDVAALEAALTRWVHDLLPDNELPSDQSAIAIDGKSLRGTWNRLDRAVHPLNVIDQRTKAVLHQRCVPGDTNEHKVEVLKDLVLTGLVVTADAAFSHQDLCQTIIDSGGHYVLPVKDNQRQLVAAISSELTAPNAAFSPYARRERATEREKVTTYNKAHGRQEKRMLTSITALNFSLQQILGWSSVRQVFQVTRE